MSTNGRMTRRGFLAVAAAAAGTAGALRPARAGANDAVRVGCIGAGARGTALLAELRERPDVRIAAVCDVFAPRRERAEALSGAKASRDWTELIARNDIDAVVVATPDHWHAPMAIAAMEAGKDVYCERPMALDAAQARAFRDTALRTGRVAQIGVQEASEGQWHTAREVVASGRLGAIRWSQGSYATIAPEPSAHEAVAPGSIDWEAFLGPAPARPFEPDRFFGWRKYWDYSGGIATDLHYHKLVPLLLALGADFPERVSAAGGVYLRDGREVPDCFVMTAEYAAGHTVVLASSVAARQPQPAVIRGEGATLYAEGGRVRLVPEGRESDETVLPAKALPDHVSDWIDCIRTRRTPACGVELAYRAMAAVATGVQAYREGRTLAWDRRTQVAVAAAARGPVDC